MSYEYKDPGSIYEDEVSFQNIDKPRIDFIRDLSTLVMSRDGKETSVLINV